MTHSRGSRPARLTQLTVPKGNVLSGPDWVVEKSNQQHRTRKERLVAAPNENSSRVSEIVLDPQRGDQLFVSADTTVQLVGGRCATCHSMFFPQFSISHNVGCTSDEIEQMLLGPTGVLSSYTTQYYSPPPPYPVTDPFDPFSVGAVAFPEGIEVIGKLVPEPGVAFAIGDRVELVELELTDVSDGSEIRTWAFQSAKKDGSNR